MRLQCLGLPVYSAELLAFTLGAHHGENGPFAAGEVWVLLADGRALFVRAHRVGILLLNTHRCHISRGWLNGASIADHVRLGMVSLTVAAPILLQLRAICIFEPDSCLLIELMLWDVLRLAWVIHVS